MIILDDLSKISSTKKFIDPNRNDTLLTVSSNIDNYNDISCSLSLKDRDGLTVKKMDKFIVQNTLRVSVANKNDFKANLPSTKETLEYPILLSVALNLSGKNLNCYPIDIFPRTLNSEVNTSTTNENSENNSNSVSRTSGSSSTVSNSFGINVGISETQGLSGGLDFRHSWDNTTHNSTTNSRDIGYNVGKTIQIGMSIKDWNSYGAINNKEQKIKWYWGQSYPWDVIQHNKIGTNGDILLPDHIKKRLLVDPKTLAQPSHLSLFGLDFLMTSKWILEMPEDISEDDCFIDIICETTCQNAIHYLKEDNQAAAKFKTDSKVDMKIEKIDIYQVSLKNVSENSMSNPAIISFDTDAFIYFRDSRFRINSSMNNLLLVGKGFAFSKANGFFSSLKDDAEITISFKIIDNIYNYNLILMHWLVYNETQCRLTVEINDNVPITLVIDYTEGKGGQNNRTEISLRNNDFRSSTFHDYLQIGSNTIRMKFEAVEPGKRILYKLFGLSINI